jgi:hypothetical protein
VLELMGAQGRTSIDFGVFPGKSDTSLAITGQGAIVSGSQVEAWLFPEDTADHLADEHLVEPIRVFAGTIVAGTGFTIYAVNGNMVSVMDQVPPARLDAGLLNQTSNAPTAYGLWRIAWAWN